MGRLSFLEEQARAAALGLQPKARRSKGDKLGMRYSDALDELKAAEDRLQRASRRWDKARQVVRRLERELDKLQRIDQE